MKMKNVLGILTLAALSMGCEVETEVESDSGFGNSSSISDSTLAGEVGGRSWTFISGRAKPSAWDDGSYSLAFWDEDVVDPCDSFSTGSEAQLLGSFDLEEGTQQLSNTKNINFSVNSDNNITTNGRMVITEIAGDKVYGKMIATFDNANYVNGSFELTLCE